MALHADRSLSEIEDARVCQLSDVAMTEEGELDGKAVEQSKLGKVTVFAHYWHIIAYY